MKDITKLEKIFKEVKSEFIQHKARQSVLQTILGEQKRKLSSLKEKEINASKAGKIVQIVAQETQRHLEYHVSNITTMALKSVSPTFPEFKAEVMLRRNQTEFDLLFLEGEHTDKPIDSSGGGALDIASFALRLTYWTLEKTRPTLILDEPFRNVSPDLQNKVSEMVKKLSEKLGLQIILVSHQDDINIAADRTFWVSKKGGISIIETLNKGDKNE